MQEVYPVTRALLDQIESCNNGGDDSKIDEAIERSRNAGMFQAIGWIIVCK